MKKFNLIKPLIALFAVFSLTMCTEDKAPIQFELGDNFEETIVLNDLASVNSFESSETIDLSDFVGDDSILQKANIKSVSLTLLEDFSGERLAFNVNLTAGSSNIAVLNKDITLTRGTTQKFDLPNTIDIFNLISNNESLSYSLKGTSENTIGDNNFSIKVSVEVSAIVETK